MKRIVQIAKFFYTIYALLLFILIMLFVFQFIMLATKKKDIAGGNKIYKICSIWAKLWYKCIGVTSKNIYLQPHNPKQQYIFVANHSSYMDIPPIVVALTQPIRVLGKYEMIYYPIFGSIYKAAVILVNRKNADTRARSIRQLKDAIKQGISIFIFPEGTFNESNKPLKNFYNGAFRIAIETQTPIKPLLFIRAEDRLAHNHLWQLSPGPNDVVFLPEISVKNYSLNDVEQLKQQVYSIMDSELRKFRTYTQ